MSHPRSRSLLRRLAVHASLLAATAAAAGAQVNITFYETYPATPPSPSEPFPGGAVICTAAAAGTATGFSFDFADAAVRSVLCPAVADRISPLNSFGARVTGVLNAPSTGFFELFLSVDDGNVLTVNGTTIRTDWRVKPGGPGTIGSIELFAGANPFVLDYFQGPPSQANMTLTTMGGVTVSPPDVGPPPVNVVPEPGSLLLTATGLAAVLGGAWRRRAA